MRRERRHSIGDLREYAVRAARRRTGAVRYGTGFYDRRKVKRRVARVCGVSAGTA